MNLYLCLYHLFFFNCLSCSNSCHSVSVLIILPHSVFVNMSSLFFCQISVIFGLIVNYLSHLFWGSRGENVHKLKCPSLKFSPEFTLLKLSCVLVTKDFNEVCLFFQVKHLLELFCFFIFSRSGTVLCEMVIFPTLITSFPVSIHNYS